MTTTNEVANLIRESTAEEVLDIVEALQELKRMQSEIRAKQAAEKAEKEEKENKKEKKMTTSTFTLNGFNFVVLVDHEAKTIGIDEYASDYSEYFEEDVMSHPENLKAVDGATGEAFYEENLRRQDAYQEAIDNLFEEFEVQATKLGIELKIENLIDGDGVPYYRF